jgi:polyhydroxybutyrate depolymerase
MKKFLLSVLSCFASSYLILAQSDAQTKDQSSSQTSSGSGQTGVRTYSSSAQTANPYANIQTQSATPPNYQYRRSGGMTLRSRAGAQYYQRAGGMTMPGTTVEPQAGLEYQRASGAAGIMPEGNYQYQKSGAALPTGDRTRNASGIQPKQRSGSPSTDHLQQSAGKGQDSNRTITSNGVSRTFQLHLPAGFSKSKSYPIVFVCHGLHMNGHMMYLMSNMDYWADQKGFIAVYPDGLGGQWERSGGDTLFINDMVKHLSTIANVDQRRIYAAGISNGGHFVQALACQSDRIAAIAVVSATLMASDCATNRSIPVILFLGTDDPLVPSNDPTHKEELGKLGESLGIGGLGSLSTGMAKMGGIMSAEETVDFWCRHNGCSFSPYSTQLPDADPKDGTRVTRTIYGSGSNEVDYYKIQGGGHSWPGSLLAAVAARDVLGRTSEDINASQLIAEFFLRH